MTAYGLMERMREEENFNVGPFYPHIRTVGLRKNSE
jgi:hypothetical protein